MVSAIKTLKDMWQIFVWYAFTVIRDADNSPPAEGVGWIICPDTFR
jgi:hypothetical protein